MKSRFFVNAASTISHQPTFGEKGFSGTFTRLEKGSELFQPVYREYIDPVMLRRMSRILRMGVASATDALWQAGASSPSGIIVGTGLGCLQDTEKFLANFLTLEGLIPPTAFILSTHNTIAGQISLSLGCHSYNITHTQNTLSFEMALLDGIMKLEEGGDDILIGAADEHIPFLDKVAAEWGYDDRVLTSGVSFFVLSGSASEKSLAEVIDTTVFTGTCDKKEMIDKFLEGHGLRRDEVDLLLQGGKPSEDLAGFDCDMVDYAGLCGLYPTASAFAFHYGIDFLESAGTGKKVLIVNELNPLSLGLILLKGIEA